MMKLTRIFWILAVLCLTVGLSAQAPANWFHLDQEKDGLPGISTQQVYEELVKKRTPRTVVVAVLDSGVDYEHEDLSEIMWVNLGEKAGNGKDDDGNGYVDDVHGWNFLGNAQGENVQYDNLELTRLYAKYKPEFEGKDREDIPKRDRERYAKWKEWGRLIQEKNEAVEEDFAFYSLLKEALGRLKGEISEPITAEKLEKYESASEIMGQVAKMFAGMMEQYELDFPALEKDIEGGYKYFLTQTKYYDTELNSREIVDDNYEDLSEQYYGNNDVRGPDAEHGTHVAGIIAAQRNNGIGMDGIAANVRLMSVRVVPDGDERDKDVANAIRYAVDNGASVINMSFGKGQSPHKKVVDDAVRYAAKHDVLLIHAAGNDGAENQKDNNFPCDYFAKKKLFGPRYAPNWIEVGASTPDTGENLAAEFSNYSNFFVDVFAPGAEMYSTVPFDEYETLQGTSMAAPVVAGVAAVLRSYFPELTAKQVKQVILDSAVRKKQLVNKPGGDAKVPFRQLSVTGGIVNLYEAFELAAQTKGKKKIKSSGGNARGKNGGGDKDKDQARP